MDYRVNCMHFRELSPGVVMRCVWCVLVFFLRLHFRFQSAACIEWASRGTGILKVFQVLHYAESYSLAEFIF